MNKINFLSKTSAYIEIDGDLTVILTDFKTSSPFDATFDLTIKNDRLNFTTVRVSGVTADIYGDQVKHDSLALSPYIEETVAKMVPPLYLLNELYRLATENPDMVEVIKGKPVDIIKFKDKVPDGEGNDADWFTVALYGCQAKLLDDNHVNHLFTDSLPNELDNMVRYLNRKVLDYDNTTIDKSDDGYPAQFKKKLTKLFQEAKENGYDVLVDVSMESCNDIELIRDTVGVVGKDSVPDSIPQLSDENVVYVCTTPHLSTYDSEYDWFYRKSDLDREGITHD